MHRKNAVERAVRTWKNHFIAILAVVNPLFPIANWCRLIPQANITLNLMRACRQNKALSAHTALYGEFHFEATPMAPPGTKSLIHENPGKRLTWAFRALYKWYVGLAIQRYWCYIIVMTDYWGEQTTDTVKFEHHVVIVPWVKTTDRIIQSMRELSSAIR